MAVPSYLNRRAAPSSNSARSFASSGLAGRSRGRPPTNATFQFAGDPERLTPQARQLIAAQSWQWRGGRDKPETAPQQRSITSGGEIASLRGAQRQDSRFPEEAQGGKAIRASAAAANPWS